MFVIKMLKMDYSVLGDAVDQAVNLGLLARDLKMPIAISQSIQFLADESWDFDEVGPFLLNIITNLLKFMHSQA